ncbi:prepilin-type N-terminal cleavage/methylation domain-containing protein [Peptococcaceae bacterium]|nr:prepilin-type N-terminal cleavage/methylation domain-containing protein [Peptococcaceae bacterium]
MLMNKKLSNQKGFTLVELLVVIAVIGILAAIIAPNAFRAIENSKVAAAISDYKAIRTAVLNHYADTGRWPKNARAGEDPNLMTNEDRAPNWNGPYLDHWKAKNPWGGDYKYSKNTKRAKDLFNAKEVICLEIQDLGGKVDEIYKRIKSELGEDVVEKDGRTVFLLIHKVPR